MKAPLDLSELFDLPAPGDPFTWALVGAMVFARGMDFLSTWLVTPTLALEANPLMRRMRWGRMAFTILTKSFRNSACECRQPT